MKQYGEPSTDPGTYTQLWRVASPADLELPGTIQKFWDTWDLPDKNNIEAVLSISCVESYFKVTLTYKIKPDLNRIRIDQT